METEIVEFDLSSVRTRLASLYSNYLETGSSDDWIAFERVVYAASRNGCSHKDLILIIVYLVFDYGRYSKNDVDFTKFTSLQNILEKAKKYRKQDLDRLPGKHYSITSLHNPYCKQNWYIEESYMTYDGSDGPLRRDDIIYREDGPAQSWYDLDDNVFLECYLKYDSAMTKYYCEWFHGSRFDRHFTQGPAFWTRKPLFNPNYSYIEFYAMDDIIQRMPHLPSITLKLSDGSGEIQIHNGSFGEVLYMTATGMNYKLIEFDDSYPMDAEQFYLFLKYPITVSNKHYGIIAVFRKIVWSDGVIYERTGKNTFVAIYPDGERRNYRDKYQTGRLENPFRLEYPPTEAYCPTPNLILHYTASDNIVDYLAGVPRDLGILISP